MKKITAVIFAAVLVFTCIPFFAGAAAWDGTGKEAYTGSGTEADPYVIDTAAKLAKIGEVVAGGDTLDGKYFVQTADIDLGGKEWTPIGDGTNPFSGIYNGKGHKISGFSITKLSNFTGLFGKIVAADNEAGVCNLTIDGSINISGSGTDAAPSVGAVAGQVNNNVAVAGKKNAVFTNITSNVDVTLAAQTQQPRAGGLFGQMYLAVVENCVIKGNKRGLKLRVFKRAPLHDHFRVLPSQLQENFKYLITKPEGALHENMITLRFWIVTIILAALTIITLKIR